MDDSLARQLAERKARLEAARRNQSTNSQNTNLENTNTFDTNPQNIAFNPTQSSHSDHRDPQTQEMDDYQLAMQLAQQYESENNSNTNNPSSSIPDNDIEMLNHNHNHSNHNHNHNSNRMNEDGIDEDYEIALQLQRQYEQENSNVPPPSSNPPPARSDPDFGDFFGPAIPGNFGQFSRSISSRNSNGATTIIRTETDADGNVRRIVQSTDNNDVEAMQFPAMFGMNGMNMGGMSGMGGMRGMEAFNGPFFQQNQRPNPNSFGPFPPFGMNNLEEFRMQGMPPMMNMNMMINNLMVGGDGMMNIMDLLQPRPRVAEQQNVDALPTDTYRAKPKETQEEKDGDDEEEDDSNSCSICLEKFKNGEEIRRLPCLHIFHKHEIDKWLLEGADKCPICRVPINGQIQNQ